MSASVEGGDGDRIEPGEGGAVALALVEDRRPRQPGLGAFEDEELEQHARVALRDAPLVVVIGGVRRRRRPPAASGGHRVQAGLYAQASTSTFIPPGSADTSTVERAGRWSPNAAA